MSWIRIKFYALSKKYPLSKLVADIKESAPLPAYKYTKWKIDAAFPATKRHAASVICWMTCTYYDEDFVDLDIKLYYMTEDYPIGWNELDEHETFGYHVEWLRENGWEVDDNGNVKSD